MIELLNKLKNDFEAISAKICAVMPGLSKDISNMVRLIDYDNKMAAARARINCESIVKYLYERELGTEPGNKTLNDMAIELKRKSKAIPKRVFTAITTIRELGNLTVHSVEESETIGEDDFLSCMLSLKIFLHWCLTSYLKLDSKAYVVANSKSVASVSKVQVNNNAYKPRTEYLNNDLPTKKYAHATGDLEEISVMWSWPESGTKYTNDYEELQEMIDFQIENGAVMIPTTLSLTWEERLLRPFPLYLFDSNIQEVCCCGMCVDFYRTSNTVIPDEVGKLISYYSVYPYDGKIFEGARDIKTYFIVTQLKRSSMLKQDFWDLRREPPQILKKLNPNSFSYVSLRNKSFEI